MFVAFGMGRTGKYRSQATGEQLASCEQFSEIRKNGDLMIEQQKASAIDFLLIFLEFIRSRAAELDAWYEDLDAMIDNNGDDNYDFDSGDPEGIDF